MSETGVLARLQSEAITKSRYAHRHNETKRNSIMKVMVIVKASKASEAGELPSQQLLTEMGNSTRSW
jgi:hypothetical protein